MARNTRREFLEDVGRGMLMAGLGTVLATDLGLGQLQADEAAGSHTFTTPSRARISLMREPIFKISPVVRGSVER
jgi:hypothetical protein